MSSLVSEAQTQFTCAIFMDNQVSCELEGPFVADEGHPADPERGQKSDYRQL